jgi:hypothetical protein
MTILKFHNGPMVGHSTQKKHAIYPNVYPEDFGSLLHDYTDLLGTGFGLNSEAMETENGFQGHEHIGYHHAISLSRCVSRQTFSMFTPLGLIILVLLVGTFRYIIAATSLVSDLSGLGRTRRSSTLSDRDVFDHPLPPVSLSMDALRPTFPTPPATVKDPYTLPEGGGGTDLWTAMRPT